MKKPNHFDDIHTGSYEKYVEGILVGEIGASACRGAEMLRRFINPNTLRHPKNDSASEMVRCWAELNEALEEHETLFASVKLESLFASTGLDLPGISGFEGQNVVDFELLKERFAIMEAQGKEPMILITPDFYGDVQFYKKLADNSGLPIVDGYLGENLDEMAELDAQLFCYRNYLEIPKANPVEEAFPVHWTVSLLDVSPNNHEIFKLQLDIPRDYSRKVFYTEYILAQLLLKQRGYTLLDVDRATYNISQESTVAFYSFHVTSHDGILHITRFRKENIVSSGYRKFIRNVVTAPPVGTVL